MKERPPVGGLSISEGQGHDFVVVVGGVVRHGRDILAGTTFEQLKLRNGADGHVDPLLLRIIMFLGETHQLARLELAQLLEHIIGLAGHVVPCIHHEQVAGGGLVIAILAGFLVGFVGEHAELGRLHGVVAAIRAEGGAEAAGALYRANILGYNGIRREQLGFFGQGSSEYTGQQRQDYSGKKRFHRHSNG